MKLGMISWIGEKDFQEVKKRGLEFVELCVNDRSEEFLAHIEDLKRYIALYGLPVQSVGRWGGERITACGICQEQLALDKKLIDACAQIGCQVFVTGCNYVKELSYYQNCTLAIAYFEQLIAHAKELGIKVATYNCDWDNFVCSDEAYRLIHGHLKDLYIKYDTSHSIYAGRDYLKETRDWAHRFAHVHLKGSLVIDGERYDDPPAGLDQTNWPAFLALLYSKGYEGGLSIEPHSAFWQGEIGEMGLNRTIAYFKDLML